MKMLSAWLRGDADTPAPCIDLTDQYPRDRAEIRETNCHAAVMEPEAKGRPVEIIGTESWPRAKQAACPFCGVIRNLERQGTGIESRFKAKYWYVSTHSCA